MVGADFLKKHRAVAADLLKQQLPATFGHILVTAAVIAAFLTSGIAEHKTLRWVGLAAVILMTALLIARIVVVYYSAPLKYMRQVQALSEKQQEKLLNEYPNAKKMAQHRYMDELMIFFTRTKIFVVRYEDITGIQAKKRDLLLHLKDKEEPLLLPCPSRNVSPVVFAYLRSKNPDIKIIRKETSV